ncbi:MAG TPA: hypothetical protein VJU86_08115 [Pyrinomonadaceae bacterium]|nr:hypothetical protein [Pyrinomonadaceae bacterium]
MKQKVNEKSPETDKSEKKQYSRPELKTYGDIRSITRGGTDALTSDSGANMMSIN